MVNTVETTNAGDIEPMAAESEAAAPETPRRRGRPPGHRLLSTDSRTGIEVQTTKSYRIADERHRTVRQLRLILNQRRVPDEARVAFDGDRITLEWAD
jgi:hypothetical protein